MSGLQLSEMETSVTIPVGGYTPFIVLTTVSGLSPATNYKYDIGTAFSLRPTFQRLALDTGAALIGSTGPSTVQADIDARPVVSGSGGSALVGFIQGGTGAVATTVQTEIRLDGLRPEQYGAPGTVGTDNSAGLLAAIVQQQATGIPVTLTPGASYGLGTNGWAGLSITLTRDLEIYGNGATLKILFAASQAAVVGAVNPAIKIDGTNANRYALKIRDLKANFNLIKEPIFAPYRCSLDVERCYPYGGDIGSGGIGDASIFIYALTSRLHYCFNDSLNCPFPLYGGQTNTGFECYDLNICDNWGDEFHVAGNDTYRGDPYNGVALNGIVSRNRWKAYFGVGFSGVAAQSTVSKNIIFSNNILSNFSGSGVQTDNFGTITSTGFIIENNIFSDASGAATPIYCPQMAQSKITGNRGVNCRLAIIVDTTVGDVIIDGNDFTLGTATPAGIGISLIGQVGTTTKISVIGNRMKDFAVNYYVGGGGNAVSKVDVIGNVSDGGARGLYINDTVTGIWVDGNDFAGSHGTNDIDNTSTNGQLGVQFGQNRFATANGVAQVLFVAAPAPTTKAADATLTIAELLTRIVSVTSATAVALTLPTGTLTDAGVGTMAIGQAFEWTVINKGSASGAVTMTAGVGHTYEGAAVVAITTSARFETRKTAANTFITYRTS